MSGLQLLDRPADDAELAPHPHREHLVALLAQRVDDVELHLPGRVHDVVALPVVGGNEALVDEGEDALLLHRDIPLTAPAGGARCGGR